jgi:hypothetical protein
MGQDPTSIQAYLDSQFSFTRQHSFEQKGGEEFDVILYTWITAQSVLNRSEQNTLNYDHPFIPPRRRLSPGYALARGSKSGIRPRCAADLVQGGGAVNSHNVANVNEEESSWKSYALES